MPYKLTKKYLNRQDMDSGILYNNFNTYCVADIYGERSQPIRRL